jgi:hypothetical protein
MHTFPIRIILPAIALCATMGVRAEFIAPEDNPPFRRDQLPLDVDTMATLSRQFSQLGSSLKPGDPSDEHSAAQCIAIAIALDPVNRQATNLRESWDDLSKPAEIKEEHLASAKTSTWRAYSWLSDKQSGKDANILADCMGDILVKLDPQHPKAQGLAGEKGAWAGWVANLSDFKKQPEMVAKVSPEEGVPTPDVDNQADTSSENTENDTPEKASFKLKTTTAKSPIWLYNRETKIYTLKLATITLSEGHSEEDAEFRFSMPGIEPDFTADLRDSMLRNSKRYLEQEFGKLPEGGRVSFSFDNNLIYSIKRNDKNLSGPGIALTHASLSGNEMSAILVGILEKENKLSSPINVWELIRFLETLPSSRVVLPKTADELLPSLIAMDKAPLFLKHDIFLAEDIEEMIAYGLKTPDENTLAVLSQFKEIRSKAPSAIGPFLSNPHVLKRLEAINASCPQFASSRYLTMVGKSQRTTHISKKVLAHEISIALADFAEIEDIEEWNLRDLEHADVLLAHETSRKALDPLERIVASEDRELYGEAIDLANSARTLARGIKTLNQRGDSDQPFFDKSTRNAAIEIRRELPAMKRKLAEILGHKFKRDN